MRFVCEWCFEKIEIAHGASPYGEVLAHLGSCDRRSAEMTLKQIAGLAAHIATLIGQHEAFICPTCDHVIPVTIGSWTAIQRQVQDHLDDCERMRQVGVAGTRGRSTAHRLAEDLSALRPISGKPKRNE